MRLSIASVAVVPACTSRPPAAQGPATPSSQPAATKGVVRAETFASGLANPWGLEPLPDGRWLGTEKAGRIPLRAGGRKLSAPVTGVPAVDASGQGGLRDVALDPAFASNSIIYFSFSEPGTGGTAGTSVARAHLGAAGLDDVRVIYRQEPKVRGGNHFGSRIVFGRDGTMWITQGERFSYRDQAQDLMGDLGKVVRINSDGSIPRDNPLVGRPDARPEIWSYGHRNVQGAAMHPETGRLWTIEHGAMGGDELNHPEAGKNYGWPVITYGLDYNGTRIGEGAGKQGMEQPVYYWDPVIAPSGMTFYSGSLFPGWRGSVLIGGLASNALVRLTLEGGRVVNEERYLGELHARIRDVREAPDGSVYVITDQAKGVVLRLTPK